MSDVDEPDTGLPENLRQEIKRFHVEGTAWLKALEGELNEVGVPPIVYHYTDGVGLRGILETGTLRFGDIFYLNDPSELKHGVELACKVLDGLTATHDHIVYRTFAEKFGRAIRSGVEEIAHFFVCCFSKNGDDLGQWRAYADNGRGYALGFDGPSLMRAFQAEPGANGQTFPVTYEQGRLMEIHQRVMTSALEAVTFLFGSGVEGKHLAPYLREVHMRLALLSLQASLLFKHKAYTHEQEYRFLRINQVGPVAGLRFRGKPYDLSRYVEFDWKRTAPDSLKTIMIGPGAIEETSRRFAGMPMPLVQVDGTSGRGGCRRSVSAWSAADAPRAAR
jgi:hypothetical protein